MNYIDQKYALMASPYLKGWTDLGRSVYNFRCPYCGDSKRNSRKRRGYLFSVENESVFKCHNCGVVCSLSDFLANLSTDLSAQYKFEKFIAPKKRTMAQREEDQFKMQSPTFKAKNNPWKPLLDLPESHPAREYIDGRCIPQSAQQKLGYVDDFNKIYEAFEQYKDTRLKSISQAIIIPFYDESSDLTYIQGRMLGEGKSRYITLQVKENSRKIYGLDAVDPKKTVWVFEGPFDSMFIENSIASAGSSSMINDSADFENAVLVFDRDYKTNYDVYSQLRSAINKGRNVVLYDNQFLWNDANLAIQAGWDTRQLEEYFKSRTFSGLYAQLELSKIKPPKKR